MEGVMEGVFVSEKERSDVRFYVKVKGESLRIINPKEYANLLAMERGDYEECHVQLKPLTWAGSCKIQSLARVTDPATNMRIFDPELFIQSKLKAVISGWSFKTKNIKGEDVPIPVAAENIDALHPLIADYILKEYANRYEMSEEIKKNI